MTLAAMPRDPRVQRAFDRLFVGRATQADNTVLDCRELAAVKLLRDGASTEGEWRVWSNEYCRRAQGV